MPFVPTECSGFLGWTVRTAAMMKPLSSLIALTQHTTCSFIGTHTLKHAHDSPDMRRTISSQFIFHEANFRVLRGEERGMGVKWIQREREQRCREGGMLVPLRLSTETPPTSLQQGRCMHVSLTLTSLFQRKWVLTNQLGSYSSYPVSANVCF